MGCAETGDFPPRDVGTVHLSEKEGTANPHATQFLSTKDFGILGGQSSTDHSLLLTRFKWKTDVERSTEVSLLGSCELCNANGI